MVGHYLPRMRDQDYQRTSSNPKVLKSPPCRARYSCKPTGERLTRFRFLKKNLSHFDQNPFSNPENFRECFLRPQVCLPPLGVSPASLYRDMTMLLCCTNITMYQSTCIHSVLCIVKYLDKRIALR